MSVFSCDMNKKWNKLELIKCTQSWYKRKK